MVLKIFVDVSKYLGWCLWMTFYLLRKSWHMFAQFSWSSANSCMCVSVQFQFVFQNAWMTKEISQPVNKIMDSGSLFLGKVPILENHFYKRSSLMDVHSIWYAEWFTLYVHRKPPSAFCILQNCFEYFRYFCSNFHTLK